VTLLGQFTGNIRDALGWMNASAPSSPSTFYRANMPRVGQYDSASDSGSVALTTQVMTSTPIYLAAGDVVTNLSFCSGATAAGTPTNWWFALYSTASTPALLAQTADQTSTAWAAFTVKTVALATAQTITTSGIYWAAIHVKATTVPTLLGCIAVRPIVTGERNLAQTSGSSLAATAPSTIATPTVANFAPYVVVT
jgi:hypothetical protein